MHSAMPLLTGKRELLARALGNKLLRPVGRAIAPPGLLTLTYHRVCDFDTLDQSVVSASVDEFRWQLTFLKNNVRVLSGDELLRLVSGDFTLREPALCITFDDGYSDNLAAGRMLADAGLPAIFFITTGFVGTETIPHWDRLAYAAKHTEAAELTIPAMGGGGFWRLITNPRDLATRELRNAYFSLEASQQERFVRAVEDAARVAARFERRDRPPFMKWDDVRALRALGHGVGAHTHTHTILSKMSVEEQQRELSTSVAVIEKELGERPRLLAYPNGRTWTFSGQTKDVARACGFLAAFSFYGGRTPPVGFDAYDLRRVWVSPTESRDLFSARITFPQLLASL
jgi:peptidoglycan/xylan/chitin deacetylase (PgdA/CDA1 family)